MKVTYLSHSGFLIETRRHRLIFDLFRGSPELPTDGKTVIFFVSHYHEDHYSKKIYSYAERSDTHYVLSREVRGAPPEASVTFVRPHEDIEVGGVRVRTLRSTDCGVAYLVDADGEVIYHAGDLHLWAWSGASAEQNRDAAVRFRNEIGRLRGITIDAAFMPLDPRQEADGVLGFDTAMRTLDIKRAFPMHFWGVDEYVAKFYASELAAPYRDRIVPLTAEGASVII